MAAEIPPGAYLKDISPWYNHLTIPRHLRVASPLDPELWGEVVVEEGEVDLFLGAETKPVRVTPAQPAVIPEDTPFKLAATGAPARFQIRCFHDPKLKDDKELVGLLARAASERRAST